MRQHLLSPTGEAALQAAMRNTPLLAFDFDGTLAPIVTRPNRARVSVAVARRLELLAQQLPVAVITGREVQDVAQRLSFTPQFIVGNHGAEDPADAARAEQLQRALDPLRDRLRMQAQAIEAAGVVVEDKRLSIALHYRCAPDQERAQALITSLLDAPGEPMKTKVFGGKRVVNVMAHDAPDKADAVLKLQTLLNSQAIIYMGDDVNDEAVFERALPHWLTVRVGRDDPHSKAAFFLDSPAEVGIALHRMLSMLGVD